MYQSEFDQFKTVLSDLCTAVNRPFTDDLLRVFWEDLRDVPLGQAKFQAKLLRTTGKTKFVSNDLRAPAQASTQTATVGPSVQDQLSEFVCKYYAHRLTPNQLRSPWTFLYRGLPGKGGDPKDFHSKSSPDFAVTGVVIPADGDAPSIRVMAAEMQMGHAA